MLGPGIDSWVGKILERSRPIRVFLLGKSQGQRGWQATVRIIAVEFGHDLTPSFLFFSFFSYWKWHSTGGDSEVQRGEINCPRTHNTEYRAENATQALRPDVLTPSGSLLIPVWVPEEKEESHCPREPETRKGAGLQFPDKKPGECHLADYAKNLYPRDPLNGEELTQCAELRDVVHFDGLFHFKPVLSVNFCFLSLSSELPPNIFPMQLSTYSCLIDTVMSLFHGLTEKTLWGV